MKRLGTLLFMLLLVLPMMGTRAQDSPLPFPLAVEYQGKQYVMKTLPHSVDDLPSSLTLIGDVSPDLYYGASWSPDGTKLVYGGKYVWDGSQTSELPVSNLQSGAPISWTQDGQLLYVSATSNADPNDALSYVAQISTLKLEAGAKPQVVIDKLPFQFGCGIGSELPRQNRLWNEVGLGNARPLWALTAYGLIYPAECDGKISMYRPTGETVAFANGNLIRAALSPDGSRLAGIDIGAQVSRLVVVDLMTLVETTLPTIEPPDVVAWGADGSLYYVAASKSRSLLDGLSAEKSAQVLALLNTVASDEFTQANRIRLYRRAAVGTQTLLHEQDAYAVGALVVKDNTLVYSTIANDDAWVQAMADGKLSKQEVYSAAAYASTAVNIITLKDDGSVAEAITLPGDLQRVAVG